MSTVYQFPKDFEDRHCPRVRVAKQRYRDEPDVDFRQFAECAFSPAGAGMTCEVCRCHVSHVRGTDGELLAPQDAFCGEIKAYYRQIDADVG